MIPIALHMAGKKRKKEKWFFKITGTGSFTINGSGMDVPALLISKDLVSWEEVIFRNLENRYISYNGAIYIKAAKKVPGMAIGTTDDNELEHISFCYFSFESGSTASLGGNINALISPSKKLHTEPIGAYAFYRTFANCDEIIDASDLDLFVEPDYYNPSDEINIISNSSFRETFYNCVNLEGIPKFGNDKKKYVTIGERGCEGMFNLTAVKDASELKIRHIYDYGCEDMFCNCFGLEKGPSEIYGNIGKYGCNRMFFACNSLFNIQMLDLVSVDEHGCLNMYNGCSSITSCVISKSSVPTISGTNGMQYMFYNCSSLGQIRTRQLSFNGCHFWLYGVSASGIFVCDIERLKKLYPNPNVENPDLSPYPIETGVSRIPVGWAQEQITIVE